MGGYTVLRQLSSEALGLEEFDVLSDEALFRLSVARVCFACMGLVEVQVPLKLRSLEAAMLELNLGQLMATDADVRRSTS